MALGVYFEAHNSAHSSTLCFFGISFNDVHTQAFMFTFVYVTLSRSWWPRGPRRRSAAARLLRLLVRISQYYRRQGPASVT